MRKCRRHWFCNLGAALKYRDTDPAEGWEQEPSEGPLHVKPPAKPILSLKT